MEETNVLLGVTGGIAAYKAAALASKLTQAGAHVRVIMTEGAEHFVTPLTFQALTRHTVYTDTYAEKEPDKVAHVDLADWADVVVIAPATANVIGKMAQGISDDMLTTTLLATLAPVYIAPAMNVNMYNHPAVQANMKELFQQGVSYLEAGEGYLACGWTGKGRMAEPEAIVQKLQNDLAFKKRLTGKSIVVTAGPTREPIDPIRYFSNPSSGKMGFAVAAAAAKAGAEVTLIAGPVHELTPAGVTRIDVSTAEEMSEAVFARFDETDAVVKTAAVADYRPKHVFGHKVKKQTGDLVVEMERTTDILKELGERKKGQLLMGFAAETEQLETYAKEKLNKKNLDYVVVNDIGQTASGFGTDTNTVILFSKDGERKELEQLSKLEIGEHLVAALEKEWKGISKL
ncbi:bifunctional phosphopantothenoylcysteine decarboxylase/phosphopantothenate--cysteine ligase CoaBC [Salsuginibacillus kocurii]|uniref:bifunctional phosphopantothenoylcysteine decarboxylase/phosphopantothenate--cysteine ligase CoaBC n=1 Tax=Salsuginibacillus kocurii TaxID=427078 RepID=UPI000367A9EE|nr:bifunctional phosphopantothenoylcysteine decarboxylase/phosphopantothenate--cysteine ligase CoaBC [Salsuginibacillus kocurii]